MNSSKYELTINGITETYNGIGETKMEMNRKLKRGETAQISSYFFHNKLNKFVEVRHTIWKRNSKGCVLVSAKDFYTSFEDFQ